MADSNPFVGTWKLISWEVTQPDGTIHYLYGEDVVMAPELTLPPSEYVRRNCYITCESDEKWLPLALAEVGEAHVVVATDYPHFDSTFPNTVSGIRQRVDLSPRQKKRILEDNALELIRV